MKNCLLVLFCFSVLNPSAFCQKNNKTSNYITAAIGFWNVENFYDTLNDKWKNDEEFTPKGANAWNGARYWNKIDHLAEAICQMATDVTPDGLTMMGLCEVENKSVVTDLVHNKRIANRKYEVVHLEGPDHRGVDPSFIYNPSYYKVTKTLAYPVKLVSDSSRKTRHILVVSGLFFGEPLVILVNHWPSRRGGELKSRPDRNAAASVVKRITDSIIKGSSKTKLVIMGDFNDDPVDESVKKIIGTYSEEQLPGNNLFYNPMEILFKRGIGSLAWQDNWNLFDQILLSKEWLNGGSTSWQYRGVRVFNKSFLTNDFGKFKGYPLRTYSGTHYTGGYSDHFPVYVVITKEKK